MKTGRVVLVALPRVTKHLQVLVDFLASTVADRMSLNASLSRKRRDPYSIQFACSMSCLVASKVNFRIGTYITYIHEYAADVCMYSTHVPTFITVL